MKPNLFKRWRANFVTGLAVVLPGVVSIAAVLWLFKRVANITDVLLIFVPRTLTHQDHGEGPMFWYWSVAAVALAVFLIGAVGLLARYYFGKRIIESLDTGLRRVPLLNKIYGTIKQVNDAFSSSNKTSFRTVVLVEYPRPGIYSVGFVTNEESGEAQARLPERVVAVFIPATPNPTSGFLVLVPEDKLTKLEMSVADGIKWVISLGSLVPEFTPAPRPDLYSPRALAPGQGPIETCAE